MKAFIIGKHTGHVGCFAVTRVLEKIVSKKYEITDNLYEADVIVVNGEGSMHHNGPNLRKKVEALRFGVKKGLTTMLVNTVWDHVTNPELIELAPKIDYISVRELLSHDALLKLGVISEIYLDLAYFDEVSLINRHYGPICIGNFYNRKAENDCKKSARVHPQLNIKSSKSWQEHIDKLRGCDLLITGMHHDAIACMKARTLFRPFVGNTHKVDGIFKWAGVDIECAKTIPELEEMRVEVGEYIKLFDFAAQQPLLEIP